jgi:hypothetical protein
VTAVAILGILGVFVMLFGAKAGSWLADEQERYNQSNRYILDEHHERVVTPTDLFYSYK